MSAANVQISKLGAAVVLFPGDEAVVISKLGAAVVLGMPDDSLRVTKLNAYVVLAPILTSSATVRDRRPNICVGG